MNWLKNPMLRLAVLFGVWGPWLGSVIYFGYDSLFVQGLLTADQTWLNLLLGTLTLYPLSLMFGGIPAALVGGTYAYYLKTQTIHNPSWKKRSVIGGALGAIFTSLYLLVFLQVTDSSLMVMTICGALAGAICALLVFEGMYYWLFPKRNPLYEQLERQKQKQI